MAKSFSEVTVRFPPHQRWMRVPVPPHPCQHLTLVILVILIDVYWYFCFNVQLPDDIFCYFFICIFVTCVSSLLKCLFISFAEFLIGLFIFLFFSFKNSLYILVTNSLSEMHFENSFSQALACHFILLTVS